MKKLRIGVVISTTRQNRFADKPTQWIIGHLNRQAEITSEVLDLRDYPMLFLMKLPRLLIHRRSIFLRVGGQVKLTKWTASFSLQLNIIAAFPAL